MILSGTRPTMIDAIYIVRHAVRIKHFFRLHTTTIPHAPLTSRGCPSAPAAIFSGSSHGPSAHSRPRLQREPRVSDSSRDLHGIPINPTSPRMTFFLTVKRAALVPCQLDCRSPDGDVHRPAGQNADRHPYRSATDLQGGRAEQGASRVSVQH